MFTGLIITVTVILLWFTSYRLYQARNVIKKEKVEWLALSSFMAGFGILCYGIRSLFIDNAPVDTFVYRLGITVHLGLSFIPASLFVYRNYISNKSIRNLFSWLTVIGALIFTYGCVFPPLKRLVKPAPFEPIPMNMSNFPWVDLIWKNVFVWFSIIVSLAVIWVTFHYALKNKKSVKSSSLFNFSVFLLVVLSVIILIMPFAAMQSWYPKWQNYFVYFYIAISIVLIWMISYLTEKTKELDLTLYYGMGIAYLLFPAMLCIFVTPIFARLLYVPGAILLFMAFRGEVKKIEETIV